MRRKGIITRFKVSLALSKEVITAIEKKRGNLSKSSFVNNILSKELGIKEKEGVFGESSA